LLIWLVAWQPAYAPNLTRIAGNISKPGAPGPIG
jgi:hypothetical protein